MSFEKPQRMIPSEEEKMKDIKIIDSPEPGSSTVEESFDELTNKTTHESNSPETIAAAEVAMKKEMGDELLLRRIQKENDKRDILELRKKLGIKNSDDSDDTMPLAA